MTSTEKYKKIFLAEAEEKIAALNTAFLGLEKEPGNSALANDAMRAAHTLKSSAATMNFMEMSHLAHAMEDVFEQIRSKGQTLAPRSIEILFDCVDTLSAALAAIKKGKEEPSTAALREELKTVISTEPRKGGASGEISSLASKKGMGSLDSGPTDVGPSLGMTTQGVPTIAPIESIKVDVATLDKIMNLTEELLVERMRFAEIMRKAKEKPNELINRAELGSSSESFDRLISELQLNVTEARMVPLGQIFERFPRMIRDLAHEQNKEVDFDISGQDIELDRTIIDKLGEPLIHLLRNAVDHGIEKTGKIHLTALQERDKVIVEVINEGRPIDWQKVIEVALFRGIIDKATRDKYQAQIRNLKLEIRNSELEALLYLVSTKDKVTETSGRGVGLSIVKSVIESLGGKVTLDSSAEETKFRLQLPLTLAIIQALLVRVANQTFALPFVQIDRSVRVSGQNIKKAFDQEIAVVEDKDIPMIRLDKLFGIAKKRAGLFLSEEEMKEKKYQSQTELMVITKREHLPTGQAGLTEVGLMVDELLSKQDIVVKPLKGVIRKTKGFAGITLLGDGRPALILDIATLI